MCCLYVYVVLLKYLSHMVWLRHNSHIINKTNVFISEVNFQYVLPRIVCLVIHFASNTKMAFFFLNVLSSYIIDSNNYQVCLYISVAV